MAEVKTVVRNCTKKPLLLKEGNGGVYRTLTTLKVDGEYTIKCNKDSTYREYWVAVRPDSTPLQANSTPSQAPDIASTTITSDDCVNYKRINITSSLPGSAGLEINYHEARVRGSRMLANRTGQSVTLEIRDKSGTKEKKLEPNRKVAIQVDSKHGLEHSLNVGGETLRIDNKLAAKAQAVNIFPSEQASSKLELKMVQKEWLLTEVTNKTNTQVMVKVNGHDQPLKPNEKYIIAHDPKCEDSTYSVVHLGGEKHITLEDIFKYECIDVESGKSAGEWELKNQVLRSATSGTDVGFWSKLKGLFTG